MCCDWLKFQRTPLKPLRSTQGIFLPSLVPNGPMVSEEKIEMFTTDEGRQVMAIAHMTLQVRRAKKKVDPMKMLTDRIKYIRV
jgi:hypothetical protein